jgi:hypothetical protein
MDDGERRLILKSPPPISCYYYICENVDGGFRFTYLHDLGDGKLGFKSIFVQLNVDAPVLQLEKLPKKLSKDWMSIKKELLERTR